MPLKNTASSYGSVSKLLHWGMAIIIIGLLIVGMIMVDMPTSPDRFKIYGFHKAFGILVLVLVGLRLAWKYYNVFPVLPESMTAWEKYLARAGHATLYFLMFAMPLSGWAMSSAAGLPVSFFGLFILPDLVAPNQKLKADMMDMHGVLAWCLVGMILLHAAAALLHHFYYKNNVLLRMLPFTKKGRYAQDSDTMAGC